ncbi:phosphate ABC transporter substrate-binding protein [Litorilituus lipolyticus]|uniref:Phosphate ABC transporter substrate-binding protein n=1 Tax=Litorilituus lipolyticus TaxID=2491017 RepID=A0A502KQM4_9GAMM|nr:phosphate ABC transporter substrate-binding protein [Litorilituus lipolyticus]TPH12505.1 phosphate ABC transporter substrate-binding protein [Litorilituus lipolyticus]
MKLPTNIITLLVSLISFTAFADIAVIINPSNNSDLSKSDISKIFLGKSKTFTNGESVKAINLKSSSAVRDSFQQQVLGKSKSQVKAYWSKLIFTGKGKPLKELSSEEDVISFIASNPNAIGYVDRSKVNDSVKVVN